MPLPGAAVAVRGYVDAGVNLVVERDLWHPPLGTATVPLFAPYEGWLVGLGEISPSWRPERRPAPTASFRTARGLTTEAAQWEMPYDLVVDTIGFSPGTPPGG